MGDAADAVRAAVREASALRTGAGVAVALERIEPNLIADFFHDQLVADDLEPIGTGVGASPGAAAGRIALTAEAALAAGDGDVILVRPETSPDDVLGMQASAGILTVRGGLASHAAVVARGWGVPAVVGASSIAIDGDTVRIGDAVLRSGDELTIDGGTGSIYSGRMGTAAARPPPELATLLGWADSVASGEVEVRANADTAADALRAHRLGAAGIGLCRTEHMFLAPDRLPIMRRFIMAHDRGTEASALAQLEAAQTTDFERLLAATGSMPVTIRLLDPPLHEFLPDHLELVAGEARDDLSDEERSELAALRRLRETNPMIGIRGVRLGALRTGLYEMQVRALCNAAATLFERGQRPHVEVMIPLVVAAEELRLARAWVTDVLDEIGHPELSSTAITVGAMIETPRAALTAGALAEHADFFSFGTNDLTQLVFAFCRDDVATRLLPAYQALGILRTNPFAELDRDGVGALVQLACVAARTARPDIRIGVCGEHAGDPGSVDFLVGIGVDSVSCSPYRVPMTRLAVARALLACGRVDAATVRVEFPAADEGSDGGEPDGSAPGVFPSPTAVPAPTADRFGATPSEVDETSVLHTLRVRGFVSPAGFEASLGEYPADLLGELVAVGHVRAIEARDLHSLSPGGRARHAELLGRAVDRVLRERLAERYQDFLDLNDDVKQLCTDWQVRHGRPNDHDDESYDRSCVDRLDGLRRRADPVLGDLTEILPRLGRYRARLADAVECVAGGDTDRFTGVMCESFHDIWMELHEDLVVVQGIDRAAEGSF